MATNYDVEVIGAEKAALKMQAIIERTDKLQLVFESARLELAAANAANFASNGLPSGKAWAPLDAKYGSWKSRRFPGRPTMVRSGRLFQSLSTLSDSVNKISGNNAQFGTTVDYARFHQRGTFKMPKRVILFEPPGFAKIGKFVVDGEVI
jgi:phage gpG-like protein